MQMTFVGGPWDGDWRPCPCDPPDRIQAPDHTVYVPWESHPAGGGVLADPIPDVYTFVAAALGPRELLDRMEALQARHDACLRAPGTPR